MTDREALIDALVMSPMSDTVGTDLTRISRTADEILSSEWLREVKAEAWDDLKAERDRLAQFIWDWRGQLGYDNDGDQAPAAMIAGAKSVEKWLAWMLEDFKEDLSEREAVQAERDRFAETVARVRELVADVGNTSTGPTYVQCSEVLNMIDERDSNGERAD